MTGARIFQILKSIETCVEACYSTVNRDLCQIFSYQGSPQIKRDGLRRKLIMADIVDRAMNFRVKRLMS